jgi:tetratricopeptide (TPR) repeat protein
MRTKILAVLITILSLTGENRSWAGEAYAAYWQKGNDLYAKKVYDSAAMCFEKIAAGKPSTPEVYYNLGNTYYRLNKVGLAVLNYERALRLNPDYKEAKENLMLTQNRIANHIAEVPEIFFMKWWQAITRQDKATMWAVWGAVLFLAALAILTLKRFKKSISGETTGRAVALLGFFWMVTLLFGFVAAGRAGKSAGAVVMLNDTPLNPTESHSLKAVCQMPEGTVVTILQEKDNLMQVRIPDGRTGWVPATVVEKI